MFWVSIAEDVAIQILLARPLTQDSGGVHFLRVALLGLTQLPQCPAEYLLQASKLATDYTRLHQNPGEYVEWNDVAKETHLLLARFGCCEAEVKKYYAE